MKNKSGIIVLLFFFFLSAGRLPAAEPNIVAVDPVWIKMMYVFISADANEVRFENVWVFKRHEGDLPWEVNINLPDGASGLHFDEPNETELLAGSGIVRKKIKADSLTDSVGFSFTLPNQGGLCRSFIKPGYRVDSMVVSVSGPAAKLVSNALKADQYKQLHSTFSGVYITNDLAADTKITINLSRLPAKDSSMSRTICLAGLALIVVIALLTMYYNLKVMRVHSSDNEADS